MPGQERILITSNFASNTGYAWNFFYRIFNSLSSDLINRNIGISLSFATVIEPVTVLDKDIPFETLEFDPLNISPRATARLLKAVRRDNIRYGYFTDFPSWTWLYPLLRLCGMRKIIVHNHISVPAPYTPQPETGIRRRLKTLIQSNRYLSADAIYACSQFVKQRLINLNCVSEELISVIPHGIQLEVFSGQGVSTTSSNPLIIFCVARATRYKGVHVLIEALKILREQCGNDQVIVRYVGDGPDLDDFKSMVNEYNLQDRFLFLGKLSGTADETVNADIIVVPSCWGDALPLSVLEAMAAAKPIIATDVGGIPEAIDDGLNGLIIKPNDAQNLAKNLNRLIEDPALRRSLARKAQQKAYEQFDEKTFHARVLAHTLEDLGLTSKETN